MRSTSRRSTARPPPADPRYKPAARPSTLSEVGSAAVRRTLCAEAIAASRQQGALPGLPGPASEQRSNHFSEGGNCHGALCSA
ncbi:hypothetical protein CO2235_130014 [Cupriavidus oxalaticus]|uniref:Uncharacterized protein n=1 Tax=Cupriavidus oxalaticus TaxID=96344 RepID=A0A375G0E6_9BURK|nr:hypothetical protein CO2235_U1070016 [Cupriavidus oxalaticus]SPC10558.1 hypothetical protein CO2235_U950031 [Cupriavidus oxalaticus]SPC12197.1 hypothetical protein CO2235_130014 [Cupriavidus oxalaticus]